MTACITSSTGCVHFSFQEMFQHLFGATGFGGGVVWCSACSFFLLAGFLAAVLAYLIGLPF